MSRDFSDYDAVTYEERDELDALSADTYREQILGLPARPGVRR